MNIKFIDRFIRDRYYDGTNASSDRIVLIIKGNKELRWNRSQEQRSFKGSLVVHESDPKGIHIGNDRILNEGGHLGKAIIAKCAAEINKEFGEGIAEKIQPRNTMVIT